MQKIVATLLGFCLVSIFLSWVAVLPFFLRKMRANYPTHFQQLGGSLWISCLGAAGIVTYFLKGKYLECAERSVRIHGGVLRWTLGFAMIGAVILGLMSYLFETFGR
jgi:hypothetical protein